MSADERSLGDLRDLIDEIDDQCHDLLMERANVVRQIALAKSREGIAGAAAPVLAMRPGREAQVLRRLAARHRGALPVAVVARMWRELISAKTKLQGPLSVSVYGGGNALEFWDLARFQYGAVTPMELAPSAQDVLNAVGSEPGRIGVLPAPGASEGGARWWPALCAKNTDLKIIAGLPFLSEAGGGGLIPRALTVARLAPEPSGEDGTLLAVTHEGNCTAPDMEKLLAKAGLQDAAAVDVEGQTHLICVSGFIQDASEEVTDLRKATPRNIRQINVLGSYACPIKIASEGKGT